MTNDQEALDEAARLKARERRLAARRMRYKSARDIAIRSRAEGMSLTDIALLLRRRNVRYGRGRWGWTTMHVERVLNM